ncbi:oxidoreductase [Zopfochytrium polystomum]|nr:oxidoreductase [Zopfochytrium polystomum]
MPSTPAATSSPQPPPVFGEQTKAEDVAAYFKDRAAGRHVIVTGANTGLGLETARVLAAHGAVVTVAARSREKGEAAVATILARHPAAKVSFRPLDLSSIASVDAFADAYIASGNPLHLLVANAGIMALPQATTVDGFEEQLAVNHLSHFRLATRLWDLLHRSAPSADDPSRVVVLSSMANLLFAPAQGIRFDDLDAKQSYNSWDRYGQSKLANILFAFEAHRRAAREGHRIVAVSLHPGMVSSTDLMRKPSLRFFAEMLWTLRKRNMLELSKGVKDIPAGASTTVFCALSPDIEGGKYYMDCKVATLYHDRAYDVELAEKLWQVSEEMVAAAATRAAKH